MQWVLAQKHGTRYVVNQLANKINRDTGQAVHFLCAATQSKHKAATMYHFGTSNLPHGSDAYFYLMEQAWDYSDKIEAHATELEDEYRRWLPKVLLEMHKQLDAKDLASTTPEDIETWFLEMYEDRARNKPYWYTESDNRTIIDIIAAWRQIRHFERF